MYINILNTVKAEIIGSFKTSCGLISGRFRSIANSMISMEHAIDPLDAVRSFGFGIFVVINENEM